MSSLLRFVPAPLVRFAGRLQFTLPFLAPLINRLGRMAAGSGVIQRGEGKGLKFNATGCNPGFLLGTSVLVEQALVAKYSTPGATVYDLGANAGFYAMIAARRVGPEGRVFAFEPTPSLCARIRENALLNGFEQVEVVEAAVSDVDGEIDFGIAGDMSVESSIARVASGAESVRVKSVTLDAFAVDHPPPSLMLIDIEGAELHALRAGLRLIATHRPVIMVEVHWLGQAFLDFVEQQIKPLGYTATTYEGAPPPRETTRYHALLLPMG